MCILLTDIFTRPVVEDSVDRWDIFLQRSSNPIVGREHVLVILLEVIGVLFIIVRYFGCLSSRKP